MPKKNKVWSSKKLLSTLKKESFFSIRGYCYVFHRDFYYKKNIPQLRSDKYFHGDIMFFIDCLLHTKKVKYISKPLLCFGQIKEYGVKREPQDTFPQRHINDNIYFFHELNGVPKKLAIKRAKIHLKLLFETSLSKKLYCLFRQFLLSLSNYKLFKLEMVYFYCLLTLLLKKYYSKIIRKPIPYQT